MPNIFNTDFAGIDRYVAEQLNYDAVITFDLDYWLQRFEEIKCQAGSPDPPDSYRELSGLPKDRIKNKL